MSAYARHGASASALSEPQGDIVKQAGEELPAAGAFAKLARPDRLANACTERKGIAIQGVISTGKRAKGLRGVS